MFSYFGTRTACLLLFLPGLQEAECHLLSFLRPESTASIPLSCPDLGFQLKFFLVLVFNGSGCLMVRISLSRLTSFGNGVRCFRRTFGLC